MTAESPTWFKIEKVAIKIDARPMIEAGEHPIGMVNQELSKLENGQILELTTPFNPAPLIDMVTGKGYVYYQTTEGEDTFMTYFTKL